MKRQFDSIAAALGLVLGVAAMVGMVVTDEYAHAAGAEARGYQALFQVMGDGGPHAALAPTALAANGVGE